MSSSSPNSNPNQHQWGLQRAILNSTSYIIISTDCDGIVTSFNASAEKAIGYNAEEIIGKTTPAIWHDPHEVVQRARELTEELGEPIEPGFKVFIAKGIRTKKADQTEWTFIRKDHTRFPASLVVTPIFNDENIVTGYLGVISDISERIEAEQRLKISLTQSQHLRATMDAHSIIAITDVRGTILEVNDQFCKLSQYTEEELIGKNHRILNSGHHPKEFFQEMYRTISSGNIWRGEIKNKTKSGSYYWVSSTIVPWLGLDGKPERYVAIRTDITKAKNTLDDLLQAKIQADAANRAKSDFLAMMSHEIRTPLNGVIGFTSLLKKTPLNATQNDFVETILQSGQHLLSLINDILDYSKMEAGKLDLFENEFDLHELHSQVCKTLDIKAQEKKIRLDLQTSPDLPRHILSDPNRIRQILINLIGNAIKFTDRGSVLSKIEIDSLPTFPDKKYIRFTIQDTGIGIPLEKQKYLFQSFSQIDNSSTRRFDGTGLGLAISKRLVELFGGEIGCKSDTDRGTEFWFTIPLQTIPEDTDKC